jgi:transcriptional regulator with XRE-family HTH domain
LRHKLQLLVMNGVLKRIKEIRREKGFSHEYVAHRLGISQPAFSKIEKNETVLSVDRLFKIAVILEISVNDLLEINPNRQKNNLDDLSVIVRQEVDFIYQYDKEKSEKIEFLYEERLKDKDNLIAQLQSIIDKISN